MVTFFRVLFCTAETRADVVMEGLEPALLPQSTSPKTCVWVSQAGPCQEQPVLFGSLERLVGQMLQRTSAKPHTMQQCAHGTPSLPSLTFLWVEENLPGSLPSSNPVRVNHSHWVIASWRLWWYSWFSPFLSSTDILGQWRCLSCLQFFSSQSVKDAKWNIQVSWYFEPERVKTKENPCLLALRTGATNYFVSTKEVSYPKGQNHGEKVKCVGFD